MFYIQIGDKYLGSTPITDRYGRERDGTPKLMDHIRLANGYEQEYFARIKAKAYKFLGAKVVYIPQGV